MNRNVKIIGGILSVIVIVLLAMENFLCAIVLSQFVLWMGCTMQMKRLSEQRKYKEAKRFQAIAYLCAVLFTVGAIVLWI